AVCELMSSQPTKSTLISTPVLSLKRLALARKISSSGCTNFTGRSIASFASFSIFQSGAFTSAALIAEKAGPPVAASAAAETPRLSASRRVKWSFMTFSLWLLLVAFVCLSTSSIQRNAGAIAGVEQVRQRAVRHDADHVARLGAHAFAEGADQRRLAKAHRN